MSYGDKHTHVGFEQFRSVNIMHYLHFTSLPPRVWEILARADTDFHQINCCALF